MLYVYRRHASTGARELADALLMERIRTQRTRGRQLANLQRGDAVICWGDNFVAPAGVKTLNNVPPINKFTEAQTLREKGVATVQVSRTRPAAAQARPVARPAFAPNVLTLNGNWTLNQLPDLQEIIRNFNVGEQRRRQEYDRQPAPAPVAAETWLARRNNHVGGNDLLQEGLREPDFYSKKEDLIEEYRLHIFNGKSVRAGKKVQQAQRPNGGGAAHPWIRSYDAGWTIRYDGFQSTKEMRTLAVKAVKALGLDFAAVDMGKKRDGSLIVLEVNRAPGLEGNTITAYAQKIARWVNGQEAEETE